MTTPVLNLSSEKIAQYRKTAIRRINQHKPEINARKDRAWELARQAASLLREKYNARRVVVFGSLIHEGCFNNWSDVDIAAWGIPANLTLRAMGAVLELDQQQEVNLVDVNTCIPSLLAIIEQEGQDL
jgi:uncharacterized protein